MAAALGLPGEGNKEEERAKLGTRRQIRAGGKRFPRDTHVPFTEERVSAFQACTSGEVSPRLEFERRSRGFSVFCFFLR